MWWLIGAAIAAEFLVVSEEESLRPGLPGRVWVAVTDGGQSIDIPPTITIEGGTVRFASQTSYAGVWGLLVTPSVDVPAVRLGVQMGSQTHHASLLVQQPDPVHISIPKRVNGLVGVDRISFLITGDSLPPVEDLHVVVGEGQVQQIQQTDAGIEVQFSPGDSMIPRVIPFGVRDLRSDHLPVWGGVWLRARPRIPVQAEPGASLRVRVGERSYGPFPSDQKGKIVARIEQYPGETSAIAILSDDLGNQTRSQLPLSSREHPYLLPIQGRRTQAAGHAKIAYLRVQTGNGRRWSGEAPTCRTAAARSLTVSPLGRGVYQVPFEGRIDGSAVDVRVECRILDVVSAFRVGAPAGVPARLRLQVWPTELSTDLPVAELRVALEDVRGERLSLAGVEVGAARGDVEVRIDGTVGTGEYRGQKAIDVGSDTLTATYHPTPIQGVPTEIVPSWDAVPMEGEVVMRAYLSDRLNRPVTDAEVEFSAGGTAVRVKSDSHGVAVASVPVVEGQAPVVLRVRSAHHTTRRLAVRGTSAQPDRTRLLSVAKEITLSPGRVVGIRVVADPPILRTGRGSTAYVSVLLEDRSGQPVVDERITLRASIGKLGDLVARPNGEWVAEYYPPPGDQADEVEIVASTETVRASTQLTLEPRLGRLTIGPSIGWISNFGRVSSPLVSFDADFRSPLLGETVVFRAGLAGYAVSASTSTGLGQEATITGGVFPMTLAALLRQDQRGVSFWGGIGGLAAVQNQEVRFGNDLVSKGISVLGGGVVLAGVGYRLGGGDLTAEVRFSMLPGAGGEVGFSGNLGGLSGGVGYRLVY